MTYHQPVISLHSGAIVEYEAMQVRAMTSLDDLGPVAGLSLLGPATLASSLAFLVAARSLRPMMDVRVSVNVSSFELSDDSFAAGLLHQLQLAGVPTASFQVELADRFDGEARPSVRRTAHLLHEHGVRLALDDFGQERSDLRTLGELDFDCIKLAPALTAVDLDSHGENVLRSIVRLANRIGVEVVATGIDLPEQHERLVYVGCDHGQGDLYGSLQLQPHPIPAVSNLMGVM